MFGGLTPMKTILRPLTLIFTLMLAVSITRLIETYDGFSEKGRGSIVMCDGTGLGGITLYRSHDGKDLAHSTVRFSSTEEAEMCFQSIAYKPYISESETIYNSERKMTGERIILLDPQTQLAEIMYLDGKRIDVIQSTSMEHVLAYEKRKTKY